jgi:hypothetical protein
MPTYVKCIDLQRSRSLFRQSQTIEARSKKPRLTAAERRVTESDDVQAMHGKDRVAKLGLDVYQCPCLPDLICGDGQT